MNNTGGNKNQFVDLDNARFDDQRQVMEQIVAAGHCPFCWENLQLYHKQPILRETTHWQLTANQWPYANTKQHLLAILKTHKETLSELTAAEGGELIELLAWAEREFDAPGGGIGLRFGDTDYSAGTVNHIHAQFIVPDIDAPNFQPTRIKIGKEKEKRAQATQP